MDIEKYSDQGLKCGIIDEEKKSEEIKDENVSKEEEKVSEIKELGTTNMSGPSQSIQILPIIGQVEGHVVLPPQTKSTKYEHIIPQLISMEQNTFLYP